MRGTAEHDGERGSSGYRTQLTNCGALLQRSMVQGHAVGIKRISNTNDDRHMCLRVLRELTLHRMLSAHPNVRAPNSTE